MQLSIFGYNINITRLNKMPWYDVLENEGRKDYHLITSYFGANVKETIVVDDIDEDCNAWEHRNYIKDAPGLTRISLRKLVVD